MPRACAAGTTRGSRPCGPTRTGARRSRRWWRARRAAPTPLLPDQTRPRRPIRLGCSPDQSAVVRAGTDRAFRRIRGGSVVDPWWARMAGARHERTIDPVTFHTITFAETHRHEL